MEPNTYSDGQADGDLPIEAPGGVETSLARLAAALDRLAAEDLEAMSDVVLTEELLELGRLLGRLEIQWLRELAWLDARGAAGAEQGTRAPSTASWLQARLHMTEAEATSYVQTARVLFGNPSRQRPPPEVPSGPPPQPPSRAPR